ncbi:MAG: ribonuclease D [Thiotrichales bacterium]
MTSTFIDNRNADSAALEQLFDAPRLGIDTEFVRERTYYPRLCLVQLATTRHLLCVDPLTLEDTTPLTALLSAASSEKIIHSAGQDFEALLSAYETIPDPVFDTQIAASLLGFDEQISYAALVKQLLNVELAKTETRTDWCKRPLTSAQIAYAEDDVRYLLSLRDALADRLDQQNRLPWLAEEIATLRRGVIEPRDGNDLLHRVNGQRGTTSQQRAVIRELAVWREQRARTRDRPRKWILADESVLAIARKLPSTPQALANYPELAKLPPESVRTLLMAIETALASAPDTWPPSLESNPFSDSEKRQIRALQDRIQQLGTALQITPSRIASRRDIERLIHRHTDSPLLRGWRMELLADDLRQVITNPEY